MPDDDPVTRFTRDLEALTGAPAPRIALAVSGGPDSLAMLLLAAAWPGDVEAATIDHGLRAEGAAEAAMVADHCAALGVPHETLTVQVAAAREGMQAAARRVRYAALADWMRRRNLPVLLTAHHLDDQAETLLMRLGRGSGVAGLAGIRPVRPLEGGGTLCRPLLGWRRAELAAVVVAAGWRPVQDSGNDDTRFARTRVRRHLAQSPWLDPVALARSAAALAQAEEALARTADALFPAHVRRDGDTLVLDPAGLAPELLRRLVARCLRTLVSDAAPRGDQIDAVSASLAAGRTTTLAGILCCGGERFRFEPAPPRAAFKRQQAELMQFAADD